MYYITFQEALDKGITVDSAPFRRKSFSSAISKANVVRRITKGFGSKETVVIADPTGRVIVSLPNNAFNV